MTVLVIRRAHVPSRDYTRDYRVLVDGEQRAQLGDDSAVQIPVTPGEHVVRLRLDWRHSQDVRFTIEHGQIVRLECRPHASLLLALLYITIWRDNYISLATVST